MTADEGELDADQVYDRSWRTFVGTPLLGNHWARHPEWETQRRQYSFFVTVPKGFARDQVIALQDRVDRWYLDRVQPDELHITLMSVANAGAVTVAQLQRLGERTKDACASVEPTPVRLGGMNSFSEGPFLEVRPWPTLMRLRAELFSASVDVLGRDVVLAGDWFVPHLTVGYANGVEPTDELRRTIEPLRNVRVDPFPLVVDLVQLRREPGGYRFEIVERYDIGNIAAPEQNLRLPDKRLLPND